MYGNSCRKHKIYFLHYTPRHENIWDISGECLNSSTSVVSLANNILKGY
jgi:hypothetical protein